MSLRGGNRFAARVGRRLFAGSGLFALAALGAPALAQEAPPARPDDAQARDSGIQDIVVTARFIGENIQDTPIPITAQTNAQLEAANVTSIGTLGAVVPNLQTIPGDSQSAGTPKLRMRGVIQGESSSIAVPPAIAIYTDDIYHPTTAGSELDFTDVDRVEVNRGPQSTLSGNASIGGSVKLYTRDPQGDNSGYLSLTGGSRKHLGIAGAIDLGLTPTLSLRAMGHFDRQDGYFDRLDFTCQMRANGTPELAGSLPLADPSSPGKGCVLGHLGGGTMAVGQVKLRWRPTDGVDLILTARHRQEDMEETPEIALFYQPNPNPNTGNALVENYNKAVRDAFGIQLDDRFQATQYNGGYANFATNCRPNLPTLTSNGQPDGTLLPSGYCFDRNRPAHNTLVSAKLAVDLSDKVHMTAITGYTDYANAFTQNGDQSPLGYVTSHFENEDHNWTGELRFDGKLFDDRLNWVVGGFIMRFTGYQNNNIYFLTSAQDSYVRGTNHNQSAFFHLDYNITDAWRISGGARYTDGDIAITIDNAAAGVQILDPVNSHQGRWDWLLSTDYKITDDIMIYANAGSGSRPPGLTTIVNTARQLAPTPGESLISYDAGVKAEFFDRRLRTNLNAFYIDYKSLATSVQGYECTGEPGAIATWYASPASCQQFAPDTGNVQYFQYFGIPAKVKGFEWEVTAIPLDGLRFDWTGGFNKFTSGVKTPGVIGYMYPGNHRQPMWNMHANLSYDVQTSFGTITPRIDWTWQSQQDYEPQPHLRAPRDVFIIHPYSIWNAQIAYESPDRDWSATLSVTNLADKYYHYQVLLGTLNAQTRVAPPREFALTIKRSF